MLYCNTNTNLHCTDEGISKNTHRKMNTAKTMKDMHTNNAKYQPFVAH